MCCDDQGVVARAPWPWLCSSQRIERQAFVQMLEFQLAQGLKSGTPANVHLVPAGAHHKYGDVLFGNGAHIRMLE